MWIYEHKDWPNFTWDEGTLAKKLYDVKHRQGLLLGRMKEIGFKLKLEASLDVLTDDLVKSWAIEGEKLARNEVRSSIAFHLGVEIAGLSPVSRSVEEIVVMMLDATSKYLEPLTKKRLFYWHDSLFSGVQIAYYNIFVGMWRTPSTDPMQIVSGHTGSERVHYVAPKAERIEKEMSKFLNWFEKDKDIDSILKAGVAHIWFESIHPFVDGNGRIGRAISDLALARSDNSKYRFYSLSSQIAKERKRYYMLLEKHQRGDLNITEWLSWFIDCLGRAISSSEKTIDHVLFKASLWRYINQNPLNERQFKVIHRMLDERFEGYMNTSKYSKLAKCVSETALRDIQELKERKIFIQNPGGGRSTSYRLPTPKDNLINEKNT